MVLWGVNFLSIAQLSLREDKFSNTDIINKSNEYRINKDYSNAIIVLKNAIKNNSAYANKFKIKDLEIDLFDKNKQIESSRAITEAFAGVKIKVFAEKVDEDNVGPIILIVTNKSDQAGADVRNFFLDYFFQ